MKFTDARSWFHRRRYGLFVHWGLYSIHGIHEQELWRFGADPAEYVKLPEQFNPKHFSAARWLDFAQSAGMEYLVLTTKHHDGFCLWDTAETDYNIMHTPFGRDVVGELAEECHKRNFPLELYYSCVDWHHPSYPNLGRHHEIVTDASRHDMADYMGFLKRQIRELCTRYGTIHGIWWDMNVPKLEDRSVNAMIRELQPAAVINNRGYDEGDYATPERDYDPEGANPAEAAFNRPTEACQSVGMQSWGYCAEEDYFHPRYFMRSIDLNLARGGNYLLNIGPDADGVFPERPVEVAHRIGEWFARVRAAFPEAGEPVALNDRRLLALRSGDVMYVHCPFDLNGSSVSLAPLTAVPQKVTLLNTGTPIAFTTRETSYGRGQGAFLRLREIPDVPCPVFELQF